MTIQRQKICGGVCGENESYPRDFHARTLGQIPNHTDRLQRGQDWPHLAGTGTTLSTKRRQGTPGPALQPRGFAAPAREHFRVFSIIDTSPPPSP